MAASNVLEVPVEFGGVSFGKETCRLSVKFTRDQCGLESADSVLNGKRLDGRIIAHHPDQAWNQKGLPGVDGGDRHEVKGSFDVKGLKVSRDGIGCGLTFGVESVDREELIAFRFRSGTLIVRTTEDLPEKNRSEDGEGDTDANGEE